MDSGTSASVLPMRTFTGSPEHGKSSYFNVAIHFTVTWLLTVVYLKNKTVFVQTVSTDMRKFCFTPLVSSLITSELSKGCDERAAH